jgi:hypothetical protein
MALDAEQPIPELVGYIFLGHHPVVRADMHIARGRELPEIRAV